MIKKAAQAAASAASRKSAQASVSTTPLKVLGNVVCINNPAIPVIDAPSGSRITLSGDGKRITASCKGFATLTSVLPSAPKEISVKYLSKANKK